MVRIFIYVLYMGKMNMIEYKESPLSPNSVT